MQIEDHWTDVVVYQVEIKVGHKEVRTLHKLLVFSAELTLDEIKANIKNRFNHVLEITRLDEIDEGLYLHGKTIAR
ncbi:hypothetical protein [Carnobacterium maltaromaticum]|uniref:hypothetical protein n=1 Tax=Carnobacterium maltaromaticum TaxID=2751 RepID=UPI0012F91F7B|nr:hypothetical protein [Carnobacterium maltaromaticum]